MAVSKDAADDMMRVLSIYDARLLPMSPPVEGEAAGEAYGCDEREVEEQEQEEEAFAAAEDVIRRCNSSSSSSATGGGGGATSTPSGRCMLELLTRLLSKMDEKSCLYDDAGLKHIFLMNNLYYIVQKVMDSPLRELLGDDWIRRHRGQIRQYETGYLRASWITVLSVLRDDGGSAAPTVKDKARSFNAAFEELYRNQTAWKVIDPQLREELRIAVSERLIPAYRSFLSRPRPQTGSSGGSRHSASKHVKYTLEDLEDYMLDFFEGVQKFVK
ncbi:Exocyst complex component 7 [Triticum urartu]|uniref:Exocyst subunit Exo70 family protein n=1 Tax=Triticum urartu TaxID=4572 RepID=M8ANJ0_TRIUA|nr:Exocyst complex component 7 [Triticum urartu]